MERPPTLRSLVTPAYEPTYPYASIRRCVGRTRPDRPWTCRYRRRKCRRVHLWLHVPTRAVRQWRQRGTSYVDDTWHMGINVGTMPGGVGRADESKPNLALSFESKFHDSVGFGQEFRLQGVTTDGATNFRPFSVFAAHDGSVIGATFTVDKLQHKRQRRKQFIPGKSRQPRLRRNCLDHALQRQRCGRHSADERFRNWIRRSAVSRYWERGDHCRPPLCRRPACGRRLCTPRVSWQD